MLCELARPDAGLAIEIDPGPLPPLASYLDRTMGERFHVCHGIDQGDTDAVLEALEAHLGSTPVDLVVDDASHEVGRTRAAFDALFPRLRPGGHYVIEDWPVGSFTFAVEEVEDHARDLGQPLVLLAQEIVLAAAAHPEVFARVDFRPDLLVVTRGAVPLGAGGTRALIDPRWSGWFDHR
jgi:hypothetical protein